MCFIRSPLLKFLHLHTTNYDKPDHCSSSHIAGFIILALNTIVLELQYYIIMCRFYWILLAYLFADCDRVPYNTPAVGCALDDVKTAALLTAAKKEVQHSERNMVSGERNMVSGEW